MREVGARVLLTGHGGDETLCSSASPAPELGDLLVQRRLLSLHRSLKVWSKASQKSYFALLWREGVIPLLPTKRTPSQWYKRSHLSFGCDLWNAGVQQPKTPLYWKGQRRD
jgi:hypothetical protein